MKGRERGTSLVAALLVFAILYLGLLAWLLSSFALARELGHARRFHRLHAAAEAGLEEALERLDLPSDPSLPLEQGGSLAANGFDAAIAAPEAGDPSWSAAFGPSAASPSVLESRLAPSTVFVEIAQAVDRDDADGDGDRAEPILHDQRLTRDGLNNLNTLFGSARVGSEIDDEGPLHVSFGAIEASGAPLLRILALARSGSAAVRLETDAVRDAIWPDPPAALSAGGAVEVGAAGWIGGFDHDPEVAPDDRASVGVDYSGDGFDNDGDGAIDDGSELGYLFDRRHRPSGHIAALLAAAAPGAPLAGAPAHRAGLALPPPADTIGLSEAAWSYNWERPRYRALSDPPRCGWTQLDGTGGWADAAGAGSGVLVVRASLRIREGFDYRGLVVVEGDLEAEGGFLVGALWVQGRVDLDGLTVLYSSEALRQARCALRHRMVGWREVL